MVLLLLLAMTVLFSLRAFLGWRTGVLLMIALAAVQDPLRKLVPGTPGWLVLVTAPVFLAAMFTSASRTKHWWKEFRHCYPSIAHSLKLLAFLSLPSAFLSATYGAGSWMLTIFGAFSYSIIFVAIIGGFHYSRSLGEMRKLLVVYCLVHGVMLSGTLMQYSGLFEGWRVLGAEALGYEWIRWGWGYTVDMLAGFYRSSDVMGWHAASVCMLSLVLAWTSRGNKRKLWAVLSVLATAALLLCGRRKMVYMLPIFLVALGWVYWQAGRSGQIVAIIGLIAIPAVSVWVLGDQLGETSANLRYYRGEGISDTTYDRIEAEGFRALYDTYDQSGFFGEGLGTATPGSHHLQVQRPRVWQESTSSRLLVELGVPGMCGFLIVIIALVYNMWKVTMTQLRARTPQSTYAAGMFSFFLANAGSLAVSGQILSDPFIAAFLGIMVGLILSVNRLQPMDPVGGRRKRAAATAPEFEAPPRDGAPAGR